MLRSRVAPACLLRKTRSPVRARSHGCPAPRARARRRNAAVSRAGIIRPLSPSRGFPLIRWRRQVKSWIPCPLQRKVLTLMEELARRVGEMLLGCDSKCPRLCVPGPLSCPLPLQGLRFGCLGQVGRERLGAGISPPSEPARERGLLAVALGSAARAPCPDFPRPPALPAPLTQPPASI